MILSLVSTKTSQGVAENRSNQASFSLKESELEAWAEAQPPALYEKEVAVGSGWTWADVTCEIAGKEEALRWHSHSSLDNQAAGHREYRKACAFEEVIWF